jgi:hypothetical protein
MMFSKVKGYMYMYMYMAADHESVKLLGILLTEHYNNKRVGYPLIL